MNKQELNDLLGLVAAQMTVDQVLDILGWDINDLLYEIREEINANAELFEAALD